MLESEGKFIYQYLMVMVLTRLDTRENLSDRHLLIDEYSKGYEALANYREVST